MPFKSEKQRKYLWANEPEIARDWTDTYGSRIHKDEGGNVRVGLRNGGPGPGGQGARGQATQNPGVGGRSAPPGRDPRGPHRDMHYKAPAPTPRTSHHTNTSGYVPTHVRSGITPPKQTKTDSFLRNFERRGIDNFVTRNKYKNLVRAGVYPNKGPFIAKLLNYMNPPDETEDFDVDDIKHLYAGGANPKGLAGLRRDFEFEEKFPDATTRDLRDYYKLDTPPDTGGEGPQEDWQRLGYPSYAAWLAAQGGGSTVDDTTTTVVDSGLGSGHYKVPDEYILAEGGRAGYQEGNMVGAEMEGAEMEGAMMESKEVIKELYDAFIAQGLSPQEAIEKIKEIIASAQTEEPQSPMMAEEFPGQEFGGGPRASAAFGGIMDTYTGRRKYGLGSFFKKAFKKVKKLAGSKLGKLALMYAAGTYLGGTQAFGGTGWGSGAGATPWKKFGAKLLDPTGSQGIGNLARPGRWGMFQKATPALNLSSAERGFNLAPGFDSTIGNLGKLGEEAVKKGADWSKYIIPASIATGAYTKYAPVEELDDTQGEWNKKKAAFDDYLASLDDEDSYRVPSQYTLAEGGRIGRQEGGLMDLGGMEKDYRNDGGFVPIGGQEKADDVPARLSRNEFVFTADAVRNAGGGDIDRGAEVMENVMKNLEGGGKISEESQGQGAQEMFEVSERLSEVV